MVDVLSLKLASVPLEVVEKEGRPIASGSVDNNKHSLLHINKVSIVCWTCIYMYMYTTRNVLWNMSALFGMKKTLSTGRIYMYVHVHVLAQICDRTIIIKTILYMWDATIIIMYK